MSWPVLPTSCVVAEIAGRTVILDQRSGAMLVADVLGAFVARHRHLFEGFDDAVAALADAFDEPPATVADDLCRFGAAVATLVEPEDGGAPNPAPPPAGPPPGQAIAVWRFDALGEALEVACHDQRVADALSPLLAAHPRTGHAPVHRFDIWDDDDGIVVAQDGWLFSDRGSLDDGVADVLTAITAVTMFGTRSTLLTHAAAVAGRDGVVVLGGGTNQGKSSTTVELMEQGFGYVTDEIVSLDPVGGWVAGLARPIGLEGPMRDTRPHLRPPWLAGDAPAHRWPVAPDLLGTVAEGGPLRMFVVLEFVDAGSTHVEQLDVLAAVAAVAALTYNRGELTAATVGHLSDLFDRTPAIRIRHDGGRQAAVAVRDEYERLLAGAVD